MKANDRKLVVYACEEVRNHYNGSGRWSAKSRNFVAETEALLLNLGLIAGTHYTTGNDAPRGGWCGNYLRILHRGRRLASIKHVCTEQAAFEERKAQRAYKEEYGRQEAEAKARLPQACSEKLDARLHSGAARNKRLNRDIRWCAGILNLSIPTEESGFRTFVETHAA